MEENRRFSWSDLFIKVILVIIFVLFTIWLLSLSNKGVTDSLDVLKGDIFAQNIERMKEVGKEYFTIERLPEKVGDIKTLTLEKMYEKNLILELTDKNGNACSAENSYVSIEKYDTEYQMKVYLECGEESNYIIVIMGCYDYCDTDICELDEDKLEEKEIEYEYKKPDGGYWTDYGKWSEWSKVSVTKTDYRQIETKIVNEEYSYDKTIVDTVYANFNAVCPSGYTKTADGTKCYKPVTTTVYEDPICPSVSGYTLVGRDGFTCNYSKQSTLTTTKTANCPSGYSNVNGTCTKYVTETTTKTASCPSGYTKSGNTCVETSPATTSPLCPSKSGWTYTGRSGFTCNYSKTVTSSDYTLSYLYTDTGSYVPADTSTYEYEQIDADYVYDCDSSCAFKWVYTYKVYKKVYGTSTETLSENTGYCPSGYTKSGSTCVDSTPATKNPTCPSVSGYTLTGRDGFTCNYSKTNTLTEDPVCPSVSGYTLVGRSGFTCNYSKPTTLTDTKTASCPTDYSKSGNTCAKPVVNYSYKNLEYVCPTGYSNTTDGTRCYKEVPSTVTVTGTREVTYYRYRIREYVGGSVDYKWSKSKEDKSLLDAGYKLTGRTR